MDLGVRLHLLGLELGAGLVGVDRLVLGGVVLEHAPQVGRQRDQRPGSATRKPDADPALDQHEQGGRVDRQRSVRSAGETLKTMTREADREHERERDLAAGELGRLLRGRPPRPRRTAKRRRDRERAEADRERLAERDDAADDRQPQPAVARRGARRRPADARRCGRRGGARPRPRCRGCASSRPRARPGRRRRAHGGVPRTRFLRHRRPCLERLRGRGRAWRRRKRSTRPPRVDELLLARVERVALRSRSRRGSRPWWRAS